MIFLMQKMEKIKIIKSIGQDGERHASRDTTTATGVTTSRCYNDPFMGSVEQWWVHSDAPRKCSHALLYFIVSNPDRRGGTCSALKRYRPR